MPEVFIVILFGLWLVAILSSFTLYGFAHLLLFIAIVLALKMVSDKNPVQ